MKKLLSLILAGTMVLSLSAPAFAEEAETTNKGTANQDSSNQASIDVKGTYLTELKSDEIISVVVAWEDMNFIYYGSQEGTWKPSDHTYIGEKTATWNKTTSDITVTNHSNVAVTADLSYTQSVGSVKGNLSDATLDLESAAQEKYMGDNAEKAPAATSTFTIDGNMEEDSSKDLGTITVSVDKTETKTVVKLETEKTYSLKEGSEFNYNFYDGHEADWSKVTLVATYSDGTTEEINAMNSSVTITYEDKTLEEMKKSEATGKCNCTLTYKEGSYSITIDVYNDDGKYRIPGTACWYEL